VEQIKIEKIKGKNENIFEIVLRTNLQGLAAISLHIKSHNIATIYRDLRYIPFIFIIHYNMCACVCVSRKRRNMTSYRSVYFQWSLEDKNIKTSAINSFISYPLIQQISLFQLRQKGIFYNRQLANTKFEFSKIFSCLSNFR